MKTEQLQEENKKLKKTLKERIDKTRDFFLLAGLVVLFIFVLWILDAFQTYNHTALILTSMLCGVFSLLLGLGFASKINPQKEKEETIEIMKLKRKHAYDVAVYHTMIVTLLACFLLIYLSINQGRVLPPMVGFVIGMLIVSGWFECCTGENLGNKIYRRELTEEIKKENKKS